MAVKMCDLKPMKSQKKYLERIQDPKHFCKSCGRVAEKEKHLCAPAPIKKS